MDAMEALFNIVILIIVIYILSRIAHYFKRQENTLKKSMKNETSSLTGKEMIQRKRSRMYDDSPLFYVKTKCLQLNKE